MARTLGIRQGAGFCGAPREYVYVEGVIERFMLPAGAKCGSMEVSIIEPPHRLNTSVPPREAACGSLVPSGVVFAVQIREDGPHAVSES